MTQANVLAASGSAGVSQGFKNRIINGNFLIWQRGTGATTSSYGYPSADRWATAPFSTPTNLSLSTSVPSSTPSFLNSLKVQRPASDTSTTARIAMQTIESVNCYDLSNQSVTLSFWAKAGANFSASGSSLSVQLQTGTTANQGGATYYAWAGAATTINTSVTLTTNWTKYTTTATLGSGILEAALLFYFTPTGTAGADDSFFITGVQLEVGTSATNFEYRDYGRELILCQRYYQAKSAKGQPGPANQAISAMSLGLAVSLRTTSASVSYNDLSGNASRITTQASGANQTMSSTPVVVDNDTIWFDFATGASIGFWWAASVYLNAEL